MIRAYHVIITAYGFWLPNDPRGSWSETVRAWELLRFGGATKTTTRRSVAAARHNRAARVEAKQAMARSPVRFTGVQAREIGHAFAHRAARSRYAVHACSILPDHVHLVLARGRLDGEKMSEQLKAAASTRLAEQNLHPFQNVFYRNGRRPTPWARNQWVVFLDTPADIARAIRYVENNPIKEGLPPQRWSFVTPYDPT